MRGERVLHTCDRLLVNDAAETKAAWKSEGAGGFYFLPSFEYKTTVVRGLFREVLPNQSPDLFPPRTANWSNDDAYQLDGVLEVRQRRREALEAHNELLNDLDEAESLAKEQQQPFVTLVSADGDDLREAVRHALEWLEFEEVIDADAMRQAAGKNKEEDVQLKDGEYFAVVEVTSGRGNAREKDFQDLLKYRYRRQRDPGRDDIDPLAIRGLLVMNQHYEQAPQRRPDLFEGNDNDYSALAREFDVGLMSSWDLFQVIRQVRSGEIDKPAARGLLKSSGLVMAQAPDGIDAGTE